MENRSWAKRIWDWGAEYVTGEAQDAFGQGVDRWQQDVVTARYWLRPAYTFANDAFHGVDPVDAYYQRTFDYVESIPDQSLSSLAYDVGYSATPMTISWALSYVRVPALSLRGRMLYDVGHKTLRPWSVVGSRGYLSGFQIGDFRFQIHKHPLRGSGMYKIPHINLGTGGRWHIMLDRKGARYMGGRIFKGSKGS